jgi:3-oxoacyl-[acyl-carrier protein] reductase
MAPSDRISQISSHLNYPRGLLYNQLAIITGAGQGIGAETARLFANEGAKVIISDIDADKANTVANAINNSGGKALAVVGDMLNDNYLKTLVEKAAEFGEGKIHIIVNNAGFTWDGVIHKVRFPLLPRKQSLFLTRGTKKQTTDKQWDTIMSLHVSAPFKLIRNAAPYFRVKDKAPRNIINILRPPRQRRTSQLRSRQSRSHRLDKDNSKRMGSFLRCPLQHNRIRIHRNTTHSSQRRRSFCDYT